MIIKLDQGDIELALAEHIQRLFGGQWKVDLGHYRAITAELTKAEQEPAEPEPHAAPPKKLYEPEPNEFF